MMVSGIVSLSRFRNDGNKKTFATDFFSLTDQNLFDRSFFFCSTFQQSLRVAGSFDYGTPIYETKMLFHVTHWPSCINPKVHCVICAMQVVTDLRWQTNG